MLNFLNSSGRAIEKEKDIYNSTPSTCTHLERETPRTSHGHNFGSVSKPASGAGRRSKMHAESKRILSQPSFCRIRQCRSSVESNVTCDTANLFRTTRSNIKVDDYDTFSEGVNTPQVSCQGPRKNPSNEIQCEYTDK